MSQYQTDVSPNHPLANKQCLDKIKEKNSEHDMAFFSECLSSKNTIELPLTPPPYEDYAFDQLVHEIKRILGRWSGIDSEEINVDDIMTAMRNYDSLSCPEEWKKYAFQDPTRGYTRNGVDDINDKANLLILVWNPSKGSLIHDHANAHCIMKILKGTLCEFLYEVPEDCEDKNEHSLKLVKNTTLHAGQVAYMSDQLGLHRMFNPNPNEIAVSLHLYTPPYAAKYGCHIYNEESGKSALVNVSTLYSDRGVLINEKQAGEC
jgi:cysteine dioxygenase